MAEKDSTVKLANEKIIKSLIAVIDDFDRADVNGVTLAAASSLDKAVAAQTEGKTKTEVAALVGAEAAKVAASKGITEVAFDRGGYLYHGRVKSLADAARKGGLKF
ncbi:MAG: 50S ribosomal protein L18 [Bacteroidales bacterium]|nr:50S ribosomal protein L18 [Bacteroidales bacterium]